MALTPIDDGLDGNNDVIKVGTEKKAILAPPWSKVLMAFQHPKYCCRNCTSNTDLVSSLESNGLARVQSKYQECG